MPSLSPLRELMRLLRDPERGCPWDRAQSFHTIVPHTLEEAYEVAAAIEAGDYTALIGELGDLLFQVIFYCQLAEEEGRFDFDMVAAGLARKLERRHPHVFGEQAAHDIATVHHAWETRKAAERDARGAVSELDDVPLALPALSRAQKLQRRAARVGFDWPDVAGVRAGSTKSSRNRRGPPPRARRAREELGDVLFTVVNPRAVSRSTPSGLAARRDALEGRFRVLEEALRARGETVAEASAVTEALWEAAKSQKHLSARAAQRSPDGKSR